jgi:hypothetical protein
LDRPNPTALLYGLLNMKYLAFVLVLVTAAPTTARVVAAESNSVGVTITSNRDEGDFSIPKSLQYQLSGEHTFMSGLILGAHSNIPTEPLATEPARILKERLAIAFRSISVFR